MTPEEKLQFERLEKIVADLATLEDISVYEKLIDERVKRITDVVDADVTVTAIDSGGDNVDVLDFPDKWKVEEYKGSLYRTPMYLESRF